MVDEDDELTRNSEPDAVDCKECDGEGEVTCGVCNVTVTCGVCGGEGEITR
jgi:DnaJ-class molecular chaperone